MVFEIRKASDDDYKATEEINSLEELMMFRNKCRQDLIIGRMWWENNEPVITIYDNYME